MQLQKSRRTKINRAKIKRAKTKKIRILCKPNFIATSFAAVVLTCLPAAVTAASGTARQSSAQHENAQQEITQQNNAQQNNAQQKSAQKAEVQKPEEKPYALIFGTVWGPDQHPLYGVKVKIRRSDEKKAKWELYSNHTGEYAQRVPAGKADYIIWADLKGYKLPSGKHVKPAPEVTVRVENDERVNTGIHLDW
jgi:hypothetical protein